MKIEKNLNEVFKNLREKWRDTGEHAQIMLETSLCDPSAITSEPDDEYTKDKNHNFVAMDAELTGDLSNVWDCCIGDSMDVEIGEGAVVIGCAFLRILQINNEDPEIKEARARHTIRIAPGCVCIGSIFRDTCAIGNDGTIIDSLVTQANLGSEAQMYMSSIMLRYGSVGNRLRMLHSAFHADPCRIGNDMLIVQGNLGLYPHDDVANSFNSALYGNIRTMCRRLWTNSIFKSACYCTLSKCDQRAKSIAEGETYLRAIIERKQWLGGNNAASDLNLKSLPRIANLDVSRTWHDSHIMIVQFSDAIRSKDATKETYWECDNHEVDSRRFYTRYEPRIKIGDNLRIFMPFVVRVGCASHRSTYRYGNSDDNDAGTPVGPQKAAWKRFIEKPYDVLIGDNVTITVSDTWDDGAYIDSCRNIGRLELQDNAVVYERRYVACESSGLDTWFNRVRLIDSNSSGLGERCSLTVSKNGRIYLNGLLSQKVDHGRVAHSHLWNVTVDRNETAVI